MQEAGNDGTRITEADEKNKIDNEYTPHHVITHTCDPVSMRDLQVQCIRANRHSNDEDAKPDFFPETGMFDLRGKYPQDFRTGSR